MLWLQQHEMVSFSYSLHQKHAESTSVMAAQRLAQLRRKSAGVDVTVLSAEKSDGE